MRILYVEDDDSKVTDVKKLFKELIPNNKMIITNSLTSGITEIRNNNYDLILLDMSLPLYDFKDYDNDEADDFETFAGIDILEEMKRIKVETNVIIITAFDVLGENENKLNLEQLDEQMMKEYSSTYKGIIHYKTSSLEWSNAFKKLIKENYKI
jgi:CheY-like chemotaxis protein